MSKKQKAAVKYKIENYSFDDGINPRDLLPKSETANKTIKNLKLFHDSWAEEIAGEKESKASSSKKKKRKS